MHFMCWNVRIFSASVTYVLVQLICSAAARIPEVKVPENVTIPAVFAFGDSIVDTGNNNGRITLAQCKFPPYGRDFFGGEPTGRFGNGKLPSDLVVELLGIKQLLPPYLDPSLQTKDLLTGVNFASSGAGYDPVTSQLLLAFTLKEQLQHLEEYIGKMKQMVGAETTSNIISNSLFLIVAGSDDIANTYFLTPFRKLYNISGYNDFVVAQASLFFEELYALGARRIGVFGVPPIGCLPLQRTLGGGIERKCVDRVNEAARLFNSKLSEEVDSLNRKLPKSRLVYIDSFSLTNDIIHNPQAYGFEVADRGCCGTGLYEVAFFCNEWTPFTCSNASKFVFWDGYHPTERAYRILADNFVPYWINQTFM